MAQSRMVSMRVTKAASLVERGGPGVARLDLEQHSLCAAAAAPAASAEVMTAPRPDDRQARPLPPRSGPPGHLPRISGRRPRAAVTRDMVPNACHGADISASARSWQVLAAVAIQAEEGPVGFGGEVHVGWACGMSPISAVMTKRGRGGEP